MLLPKELLQSSNQSSIYKTHKKYLHFFILTVLDVCSHSDGMEGRESKEFSNLAVWPIWSSRDYLNGGG